MDRLLRCGEFDGCETGAQLAAARTSRRRRGRFRQGAAHCQARVAGGYQRERLKRPWIIAGEMTASCVDPATTRSTRTVSSKRDCRNRLHRMAGRRHAGPGRTARMSTKSPCPAPASFFSRQLAAAPNRTRKTRPRSCWRFGGRQIKAQRPAGGKTKTHRPSPTSARKKAKQARRLDRMAMANRAPGMSIRARRQSCAAGADDLRVRVILNGHGSLRPAVTCNTVHRAPA